MQITSKSLLADMQYLKMPKMETKELKQITEYLASNYNYLKDIY